MKRDIWRQLPEDALLHALQKACGYSLEEASEYLDDPNSLTRPNRNLLDHWADNYFIRGGSPKVK